MHLLPVEVALAERVKLLEMSGPGLAWDDGTFQPYWLPIVAGARTWFGVDMRGNDLAPVHVCFIEDGDWRVVAEPSITSMVEAWNAAFDSGRYLWDRIAGCWEDYDVDPEHPEVT